MIALWVILGVVLVLVVWVIAIFNGLVVLKNRTKEAWSDIDVQLKRRYDLIPNLVESVKGYAKHEKELFEKVTKARAEAMSAEGPAEQAQAENALSKTLKSIFAVAENYPQLRASENFQKLQDELTDTENKIEAARRFYNANVRDLNIKIEKFPDNAVAGMFGYKQMELFELEEPAARESVKVKF
ncbi:MAG TPA: LemA family protein [Patescibacteria group bacterium]|nr:LemA family protein [Patescibacteria group bacterium]